MASSDFEKDIVRKFLSNEDSKIVWLSLINFGEPVSRDANWKINNINLNIGYLAVRLLKGGDGCIYRVECCIERSHLGPPFFSVSAFKGEKTSEETITFNQDLFIKLTSLKVTTVSNEIIKTLGVATSKRWSGVKFFGLD